MDLTLLPDLAIAAGLGLLVGLERERRNTQVAGLRTFTMIALLGAMSAALASAWGGWVLGVGLAGVIAFLLLGNIMQLRQGDYDPGMTTEIAAMVMFTASAALVAGYRVQSVIVVGGVALLLHWKKPLHGLVARIGEADFKAIMRLVLIALVILPVLPDRTYGPYAVLNPFRIWLMVVLIVGISMGAYVAYKVFGARAGTLMAGALGGLISSTAATVGYARRAQSGGVDVPPAAVMILLASTVVFLRVLAEIAIVGPSSFAALAPPILAMLLIMAALSAAAWRAARHVLAEPREPEPPSDLRAAIVFGLLYGAVLFAVAAAREHLGAGGLFLVAALSGLTDMDAITLSTTQLVGEGRIAAGLGWRLILIASMANLVFKGAAVAAIGAPRLFARIAVYFGLALVGGAALLVLWPA